MLSSAQIKELQIALAGNQDGLDLLQAIDSSTPLTDDQLKKLEIACADLKAAAEIAAAIAAPANSVVLSYRTRKVLQEMMSTPQDGDALKAEIEKN